LKLARESIPFIVIPAVLGVLSLSVRLLVLTMIFALVVAFMAYFFRDPRRVPPQDPNVVVAPADGR
jgi:phosphatidylserine decarboxylase